MIKKIKRYIKLRGRNQRIKKILSVEDSQIDLVFCGNDHYGGFSVVDGMLNYDSIVYTFGIGEDLSFSEFIINKWGCQVYAFDPTPKAIKYVNSHSLINNERFHFYNYGISNIDGVGKFHLPKNESNVSGSLEKYNGVKEETIDVELKRLPSIMKELDHKNIDLLKMDIEGTEFDVIDGLQDNEIRFTQLCVEIHDRFFTDGERKVVQMKNKLMGGVCNSIRFQ